MRSLYTRLQSSGRFFGLLIALLFALWASAWVSAADYPKVGHYTSSAWGFSTNSFWIEGPTGLILVDTQFLPSACAEAVAVAERYTGKKVVLAVVLHANPDKFNGTGLLQARGIKVITSNQVRALIPEVDALRRKWFYDRYQPDYPEKLALPEGFGERSKTIKAAGLQLTLHVLGAATSKAHIALQVGPHLFAGDLLANKHHSWLELGLVDQWMAALNQLDAIKPSYVYPGRGYPADASLIDDQRIYLKTVRDIVQAELKRARQLEKPLDSKALRQSMIDQIKAKFANYQNDFFVERAVDVLMEKYQSQDKAAP